MNQEAHSNSDVCVGLDELVSDVVQLLESRLNQQGIWVTTDVPPCSVALPSSPLKRAIYQMVADACDQMPEGGDLSIAGFSDAQVVELEVADSSSTTSGETTLVGNALRQAAMKCGGSMRWVNCAQGGTARILQIQHGRQRAAA